MSSSSSDEEIMNIIAYIERPKIIRNNLNFLELYNDKKFMAQFGLTKSLVMDLVAKLKNNLTPFTQRSTPLNVAEQILVTLRFYATGSFQTLNDLGVHKSTVCRVVKRVSAEIARIKSEIVEMPSTMQEIMDVKTNFFNMSGFPNVVGCIDGTHIQIQSPGGINAGMYKNKNGFSSINVQLVCDSKLLIRDIVAHSPGSIPDSTVFKTSDICARLEDSEFDGYILGDNAYPCKEHLLTPLQNPTTEAEILYNSAHLGTRACMKQTIDAWKKGFPCLLRGLRLKHQTALSVIVATSVLHNIARINNMPIASSSGIDKDTIMLVSLPEVHEEEDPNAKNYREPLIMYFKSKQDVPDTSSSCSSLVVQL